VASDFDKLFGDDWRPQDAGADTPGGPHNRDDESSERNLFDSVEPRSSGSFFTSETETDFHAPLTKKKSK